MDFDAISWRKSCGMTEPDLVQALLCAIASGDDAATEVAAQALVGRRSLLPALRPLLTDADPDRRWWAVRTLALIGGEDAARLMIEHLTDDDEPTRCAAALGLGELRYSQAISALVAHLADNSGWVRDSAADALAMLGEAAISALVEALADRRDGVRVRAAGALHRILLAPSQGASTTPEIARVYLPAINALYLALNDPNRLVRHHAQQTLDRLGLLETVWVAL
jgi:HEAT repeat protein